MNNYKKRLKLARVSAFLALRAIARDNEKLLKSLDDKTSKEKFLNFEVYIESIQGRLDFLKELGETTVEDYRKAKKLN